MYVLNSNHLTLSARPCRCTAKAQFSTFVPIITRAYIILLRLVVKNLGEIMKSFSILRRKCGNLSRSPLNLL
jgi:hypothetical protein